MGGETTEATFTEGVTSGGAGSTGAVTNQAAVSVTSGSGGGVREADEPDTEELEEDEDEARARDILQEFADKQMEMDNREASRDVDNDDVSDEDNDQDEDVETFFADRDDWQEEDAFRKK